ncbi:MAG: T9SS type A sorting domain-containing protein [Candidatus Kapabacteria bacterium]|nr:T9SS type A sorting domain-containing protein [Candidatus Kapabacteria bacterium]
MDRKSFLKGIGLAGVGLTLAPNKAHAVEPQSQAGCTLIPSETAGPFPWDLTANNAFFRQDVREDRQGVPLNLKLRILGQDNCQPMQNVRVNIWHCDKDGSYSAYDNSMNPGQAGKTYCRGWQIADANGEVNFTTIFPGWYQGRICHIHFQVYVSSVYAAISQLTFPLAEKNALYAKHSTLYTKGADPLSFTQDNIFSDGYNYQLATLTSNDDGSYSSFMEVAVRGSGITGLIEAEPETGGQFTLGQNYPNPCAGTTTIPFTLAAPAHVQLALFDLNGRKVADILNTNLPDGSHSAAVVVSQYGLPVGAYAYQLEVTNSQGTFRQSKMITGR